VLYSVQSLQFGIVGSIHKGSWYEWRVGLIDSDGDRFLSLDTFSELCPFSTDEILNPDYLTDLEEDAQPF
jgi:hypothetical protein